jgi:hypothetical protein
MKDKQVIYRPTVKQLRLDKEKEAYYYLLICAAAAGIFFLLDASTLIFLLPFGFPAIYLKYLYAKKYLHYRCIKLKVNMISQEALNLNNSLKDFSYTDYESAHLRGEYIYLKPKGQKLSLNMKVSLNYLNVEAYPDKEKIASEINERIKNYRK